MWPRPQRILRIRGFLECAVALSLIGQLVAYATGVLQQPHHLQRRAATPFQDAETNSMPVPAGDDLILHSRTTPSERPLTLQNMLARPHSLENQGSIVVSHELLQLREELRKLDRIVERKPENPDSDVMGLFRTRHLDAAFQDFFKQAPKIQWLRGEEAKRYLREVKRFVRAQHRECDAMGKMRTSTGREMRDCQSGWRFVMAEYVHLLGDYYHKCQASQRLDRQGDTAPQGHERLQTAQNKAYAAQDAARKIILSYVHRQARQGPVYWAAPIRRHEQQKANAEAQRESRRLKKESQQMEGSGMN